MNRINCLFQPSAFILPIFGKQLWFNLKDVRRHILLRQSLKADFDESVLAYFATTLDQQSLFNRMQVGTAQLQRGFQQTTRPNRPPGTISNKVTVSALFHLRINLTRNPPADLPRR